MKRKSLLSCAALTALLVPSLAAGAPPDVVNRLFVEAARRIKPSVVNIIIYRVTERNGKKSFDKSGFGSGTLISKDGYVVTNNHVVRKGNYYQVVLHDGTECEVERLAGGKFYLADIKTDLAILKVQEREGFEFTPAVFSNSDELEEGEWVMAVGNPYGLRQSFSSGIVSSKGRSDVGFADIEDFIQTDVPINPGNSGGPLVNLSGQLVGINTAIRTVSGGYQGISFAIPSTIVRQVCYELIRYGRIRRGWLGFLAREGRLYRKGETRFVEVISVIRGSPADLAGISKGDVIREIDGKRITTLGELIAAVGNKPLGARIGIAVAREGHLYSYELTMKEKEEHLLAASEEKNLVALYGIELSENSRSGEVVISYLSPMGIGYQKGLKRGDVVKSLNGRPVGSLVDFNRSFRKDGSEIKSVEIIRDEKHFTVGFSLDNE